jgi:Mce-associated membrane protein
VAGIASGLHSVTRLVKAAGRLLFGAVRAVVGAPRALWRSAHRHPRAAVVGLGSATIVLLAAAAVFSVLAFQQAAAVSARAEAKAAGGQIVTQLLSYDYRTAQQDIAQRSNVLTGHFKDDYTKLMQDSVMPAAVQQQVTTRTDVTSSAVVSNVGSDQVTLLMFLNQTTQSSANKDPVFNGSRVRMTMQKTDGRWLVSDLTPV